MLVSAPVPANKAWVWVDVVIDFLGPVPSGERLLVIVDYFSRWMDVKISKVITAEATVDKLKKIRTKISRLGDRNDSDKVVERDFELKGQIKERANESRKAKSNKIQMGDRVYQKKCMSKNNKSTTTFNKKEFDVVYRQGPVVTLSNDQTAELYEPQKQT